MPRVDVVVETSVSRSARARQLEGMFDVPSQEKQRQEWHADLPIDEDDWNIGLIVGPSGCGKTTVARELFGDSVDMPLEWGAPSVIDDFAHGLSVQEISEVCSAVGFNTIPAWLRPYEVLSNGEKFRVSIARRLLEQQDPIVVDEFTSVVDRQVARIGCHAIQKKVRRDNKRFVGVACHYDIVDWLQPDWVYEPASNQFYRRSLRPRPALEIEICRVDYSAWKIFAPYHYMTADLHKAAQCFCLFVEGEPACIAAILYRPHPKRRNIYGVSRLVVLPDYQGLGLAFVLMDYLGEQFRALGRELRAYPAHPALIRAFDRSSKWRIEKKPAMSHKTKGKRTGGGLSFGGRPNAVFSWAGDAGDANTARDLIG